MLGWRWQATGPRPPPPSASPTSGQCLVHHRRRTNGMPQCPGEEHQAAIPMARNVEQTNRTPSKLNLYRISKPSNDTALGGTCTSAQRPNCTGAPKSLPPNTESPCASATPAKRENSASGQSGPPIWAEARFPLRLHLQCKNAASRCRLVPRCVTMIASRANWGSRWMIQVVEVFPT